MTGEGNGAGAGRRPHGLGVIRAVVAPGLALLLAGTAGCAHAPQVADISFRPAVSAPAYPGQDGPVVCVDEAHGNFHTASGRYLAFAELLRRDGYVVQAFPERLGRDTLAECRILVIANPLARANQKHWRLPAHPAFGADEVTAVREWVTEGGALLLIADHMPFPGAAAELAEAFGVYFSNGFAPADAEGEVTRWDFRRADGTLADHPITRGREASEAVDSVRTFVGQAFRAQDHVRPLLTLPARTWLLMPAEAWEFSPKTPRLPAAGLLQGAAARVGRGRLAVFGEAAMFSAQLSGREKRPVGMNHPEAARNPQFLLNVLHWLSGLLDAE